MEAKTLSPLPNIEPQIRYLQAKKFAPLPGIKLLAWKQKHYQPSLQSNTLHVRLVFVFPFLYDTNVWQGTRTKRVYAIFYDGK